MPSIQVFMLFLSMKGVIILIRPQMKNLIYLFKVEMYKEALLRVMLVHPPTKHDLIFIVLFFHSIPSHLQPCE